MNGRIFAMLAIASFCGCTSDATDEGTVCIGPQSAGDTMPVVVEENQPVVIRVIYNSCLSGCAHDLMGTCSVERDGNRLVVHSEFSYNDSQPPGTSCAAVCKELDAQCQTVPLEAGTYTVVHGDSEVALTVPSTLTNACLN